MNMFSGIVETTSPVISAIVRGRCRCVMIKKPRGWKLHTGESVNVDGICSTIVAHNAGTFEVEYMPETLSKTTAGMFSPKRAVNLERSLRWSGRVHGHFVAGHVEAVSRVVKIEKQGRSRLLTISVLRTFRQQVVLRGSIAVNGVSLTVARVGRGFIAIALIPYTLRATDLGALKRGDAVNIEYDLLARYALGRHSGRVKRHAKKRVGK